MFSFLSSFISTKQHTLESSLFSTSFLCVTKQMSACKVPEVRHTCPACSSTCAYLQCLPQARSFNVIMEAKDNAKIYRRSRSIEFGNDTSGTISATLFSTRAEKLISHTALELMEAAEKNAPMNDQYKKKIDKTQVTCFLNDYDRSYESRFERTFPGVKLYVEEKENAETTPTLSSLAAAAPTPTLQSCVPMTNEKVKQMFSQSTKSVVDEIAIAVVVDRELFLQVTSVRRGIVLDETSGEKEDILGAEKVLLLLVKAVHLVRALKVPWRS